MLTNNHTAEITFDKHTNLYHATSPLHPGTVAISADKEDATQMLESYLNNFS